MRRTAFLLKSLLVLGTAYLALLDGAAAQPASNDSARTASEPAAVAAIRPESEAFVAAFNAADAKEIAALWTASGEYIDHTGHHFLGRDAIEKGYAALFAENPNTKIQITIDAVRMLSNNTAIEDGRAVAVAADGTAGGFTPYTAVHVKVNGKWKKASVRDSFVKSPPAASSAADLAWLVGAWEAEEHGVKTVSVCLGNVKPSKTTTPTSGLSKSAPARGDIVR